MHSFTPPAFDRHSSIIPQTCPPFFANVVIYDPLKKRLFDIVFSLLLLLAATPIMLLLVLALRLDGGPIFFGHKRIGQDGKAFKCWKFRTMIVGAEDKLSAYLAEDSNAAKEWAASFKLSHDPRITKLGSFLRKTSLDELPQIWNVLKGEMSIVGPRPVVKAELKKYGNSVGAYLAQKPGITGPWQVSGRNNVSYEKRVQLDVLYQMQKSFRTDLKLVLQTGVAIIEKTGR